MLQHPERQQKLPDVPPELTRGQGKTKKWRERRHDHKTGAAQTRDDTFKTSDMASTNLLPPPHNPQPKSPFLLCYMAVLGAASLFSGLRKEQQPLVSDLKTMIRLGTSWRGGRDMGYLGYWGGGRDVGYFYNH